MGFVYSCCTTMTELFPLVEDLWLEVLLSLHFVPCSAAEVPNHRVVDRYQTVDDLAVKTKKINKIECTLFLLFPYMGLQTFILE